MSDEVKIDSFVEGSSGGATRDDPAISVCADGSIEGGRADGEQPTATSIARLPVEMLEKVLLNVAIARSSPTESNAEEVFQCLTTVCEFWRTVIGTKHFQEMYSDSIAECEC